MWRHLWHHVPAQLCRSSRPYRSCTPVCCWTRRSTCLCTKRFRKLNPMPLLLQHFAMLLLLMVLWLLRLLSSLLSLLGLIRQGLAVCMGLEYRSILRSQINKKFRAGVAKVSPAGQIRPAVLMFQHLIVIFYEKCTFWKVWPEGPKILWNGPLIKNCPLLL